MLLVDALSHEFAARAIPLCGRGEQSVFGIHRDVRFSRDKHAYKTHAGATLSRDGQKLSAGIFYIHVSPQESFAAAGFYQPSTRELTAIRSAIAASPSLWLALEQDLAKSRLALSHENKLSRLPRGFTRETDLRIAGALKHKSFIVRMRLDPESLYEPWLVEDLVDFTLGALPLLQFGWHAIDGSSESRD